MKDAQLKQIIKDAHAYTNDARIAARRKLLPEILATVRARLSAAQKLIADAIAEIDERLENDAAS